MRDNTKSKQVENQLKLREMFAEEKRWEVHRTILYDDKTYWNEIAKKNKESNWNSTRAKEFFALALFDYLGLFENAKMMLDKGQLSEADFKTSYKYRIENLKNTKLVTDMLDSNEGTYWTELKELINRVCE